MLCQIELSEEYESNVRCNTLSHMNHTKDTFQLEIYRFCSPAKSADTILPCHQTSITARFVLPQEASVTNQTTTVYSIPLKYDTSYRKAVCTVQTFRNDVSGTMLYLFSRYYLELGWLVIVYDRFGQHEKVLATLRSQYENILLYHPYTIFQFLFPSIYGQTYYEQQVRFETLSFMSLSHICC